MTIVFIYNNSIKEWSIKEWPNWSGEIPQKGDDVLLHFGDYNEDERRCRVEKRIISGTEPDKVILEVTEEGRFF